MLSLTPTRVSSPPLSCPCLSMALQPAACLHVGLQTTCNMKSYCEWSILCQDYVTTTTTTTTTTTSFVDGCEGSPCYTGRCCYTRNGMFAVCVCVCARAFALVSVSAQPLYPSGGGEVRCFVPLSPLHTPNSPHAIIPGVVCTSGTESGSFTCGDCPEGTTGDGQTCSST